MMAIFNSYNQSGKLLESKDELLTKENVGRYIAEHGEEKAIGYIEALKDFEKALAAILDKCNAKPSLPMKDIEFLHHDFKAFLKAPKIIALSKKNQPDSL